MYNAREQLSSAVCSTVRTISSFRFRQQTLQFSLFAVHFLVPDRIELFSFQVVGKIIDGKVILKP